MQYFRDLSRRLLSGTIWGLKFSHFFLSIGIIFVLAYILGHGLLINFLAGNDSPLHLTYIEWLNRYWPKIPLWWPEQNGGVSFIMGYPIFSHVLTVYVHKLTGLSLTASFQMLGFVSIPITALGIYLFCWTRLKNQNIGLLSAIFYLLMPIAWVWITDWGFYAEAISYIFVPPALIFFDLYLSRKFASLGGLLTRLWLLLAVLFLSLTTLTHVSSGLLIFFTSFIYGAILGIVRSKKDRFKNLKIGIFSLMVVLIFAFLVAGFWFFPFWSYQSFSAKFGQSTASSEQIRQFTPASWQILSLAQTPKNDMNWVLRNISFPVAIWGLATLGLLFSAFYSRKLLALGIFAFLGLFFIFEIELAASLNDYLPGFRTIVSWRTILIPIKIILPVLAAFGVWQLPKVFLSLFNLLWHRYKIVLQTWQVILRNFLVPTFAFIIAFLVLNYFRSFPNFAPYIAHYGPNVVDLRNIWDDKELALCLNEKEKKNLCQNLKISTLKEQFSIQNWPSAFFAKDEDIWNTQFKDSKNVLNYTQNSPNNRIDFAPDLGSITKEFNLISNVSQINLYTFQISLIRSMWGYFQSVFYSGDIAEYTSPKVLDNLAKWFGIKTVFLSIKDNPLELYDQSGKWPKIFEDDKTQARNFSEAKDLGELLQKPTVLVIGNQKKSAFEPVFRTAVAGALPFDSALLVLGKDRIDDYSLEELKNYSGIYLQGYSYKNKTRAFETLKQYVEEGGRLYIDTGWQYVTKDFEGKNLPDVFPVTNLEWTKLGEDFSKAKLNQEIFPDVNPSLFNPLVWEGQPWGVSLPVEGSNLHSFAQPFLEVAGRPVVAGGKLGEGRVVWSGLNLAEHARYQKISEEEIKFFERVWQFLNEGLTNQEYPISWKRENPDKIEFEVSASPNGHSELLWREAQYPYWQATLVSEGQEKKLQIDRAGPGFMLIHLPKVNSKDKVILEFKKTLFIFGSQILALSTLIILIIYVLDAIILKGKIFEAIFFKIRKTLAGFTSRGSQITKLDALKEEEDY